MFFLLLAVHGGSILFVISAHVARSLRTSLLCDSRFHGLGHDFSIYHGFEGLASQATLRCQLLL